MTDRPSLFTPEELRQWQANLAQANDNNVFCHCKDCDREWIASSDDVPCPCGSRRVEYIPCWQFPDG
jgi:Zn finger protein HypA/HybF involved in hydrogenase expression